MRLTFVLSALGIAAFAFAALTFSGTAQAKTVTVETGNFYFCDSSHQSTVCETAVEAGDTVTWNNVAGTHQVHQCTDATFSNCDGGFNLGAFNSGQTKSQTFTTVGDVFYHCDFHENMTGKITVAAAATATAAPTTTATQPAVGGTITATPASVPSTGGPPEEAGSSVWQYLVLGAGGVFMAGAAAAFVVARRRA
jgi:plastocyanin